MQGIQKLNIVWLDAWASRGRSGSAGDEGERLELTLEHAPWSFSNIQSYKYPACKGTVVASNKEDRPKSPLPWINSVLLYHSNRGGRSSARMATSHSLF